MKRITVPLGERSYDVHVGNGILQNVNALLPANAKRAVIVTQENIPFELDLACPSKTLYVPSGENAKSFGVVESLCGEFARFELTRNDVVLGLGGGAVTDVAGFAAAVYHRGTAYLALPTTLLGQIDAAVGGKTAVNIPEGKNLVGAIWQPCAVVCDVATLATLPAREMQSGLGELAKYHFLGSRVDMDTEELHRLSLEDRIARCVELKAKVVSADERDGRFRFILNYGHTLAHAIEITESFEVRHGEAVAIGLHFAARLSRALGRIDEERVQMHLDVLHRYDLPTTLSSSPNIDALLAIMRRDKKNHDGMTFVLDEKRNHPVHDADFPASNFAYAVDVVDNVDEQIVRSTIKEFFS